MKFWGGGAFVPKKLGNLFLSHDIFRGIFRIDSQRTSAINKSYVLGLGRNRCPYTYILLQYSAFLDEIVAINNSKFKQNSPDNDILHLILGIHAKACACFEKLRVGAKKLLKYAQRAQRISTITIYLYITCICTIWARICFNYIFSAKRLRSTLLE